MTITLGFWSISILATLVMMAFSLYLSFPRASSPLLRGWTAGEFLGALLLLAIPVLWLGLLIGRLLS